ncbi:MAG: hypothetical protein J6S23_03835, partial [Clostridia bacterium]|nr:hypothetical protein [Clostridia bacterium]
LSLPIAFMKIEGGYGVSPRWGDKLRKGKMRSYVSRVVEPEEYKSLSDDEFMKLINEELYVNEAKVDGEYVGKDLAEYLERAIYYCPECGLSTFESHGDKIECKKCGMKVKYLPTKELQGVNCEFSYRFVADWYEAQLNFVNKLDLLSLVSEPIYCEKGSIFEVVVYKNKKIISENVEISLFGDRIDVSGEDANFVFLFDDIRAITVCSKNKLNLYYGDKVYQITGGERFNALKYVNLVFRYRNIKKAEKGEEHVEFLGL